MRKLVRSFHQHLTNRHADKLEPWLAEALDSNLEELKNFTRGLRQDYEAVKLAFTLPWSNGQVGRPSQPTEDIETTDVRSSRFKDAILAETQARCKKPYGALL